MRLAAPSSLASSWWRRLFRPLDVERSLDVEAGVAAKKLAHWAEQGWLRRVRRGLYSASRSTRSIRKVVGGPLGSRRGLAVLLHRLDRGQRMGAERSGFPDDCSKATAQVRTASVQLLDHDYLVSSVDEVDLQWGVKTQWRADVRLRFADAARTVIDILDTLKIGGGMRHGAEILAAYCSENDPATLIAYGDRLGNRAVFKRLGLLPKLSVSTFPTLSWRAATGSRPVFPLSTQPGRPEGASSPMERAGQRDHRDSGTVVIRAVSWTSCVPFGLSILASSRRITFSAGCSPGSPSTPSWNRPGSSRAALVCVSVTTKLSGSPRTSTSRSSMAVRRNQMICSGSSAR